LLLVQPRSDPEARERFRNPWQSGRVVGAGSSIAAVRPKPHWVRAGAGFACGIPIGSLDPN
jgi:hypothetical protein